LAKLHIQRVNRTLREQYAQQVVDCMERKDNSTTLPGKRDTKRTEDGTKQKRILSDYLNNMYDKFRLENPKISKTTFLRKPDLLDVGDCVLLENQSDVSKLMERKRMIFLMKFHTKHV